MSALQTFFDEMKAREVSNESLDIDVGELLSYCIESKSKELNEIGKFIKDIDTSLESLQVKKVTTEVIASFESKITSLLEYTGGVGLEKLFVPSFESVSAGTYTTEAEEKAEAAKKPLTEKMKDGIKFVLDKLAKLFKWLKKQTIDRLTGRHKDIETYLTDLEKKASDKLTAGEEVSIKIPGIFVYDNKLNVKAGIAASDRGHSLEKDLKKYLEALKKRYKNAGVDALTVMLTKTDTTLVGSGVSSKLNKSAREDGYLGEDKTDPITVIYRKGTLTGIHSDIKSSINAIHASLKEAEPLVEKIIDRELKDLELKGAGNLDDYNKSKESIMHLKKSLEYIYKEFERYSKRVHDGVYKIKLK